MRALLVLIVIYFLLALRAAHELTREQEWSLAFAAGAFGLAIVGFPLWVLWTNRPVTAK